MSVQLNGITRSHDRGYASIIVVSQRFCELHPDVSIHWEKRSLQEFADVPIENLAKSYDLLVIDHPWAGLAATTGILLPLEKYLPKEYLDDQFVNSVSASHLNYNFNGLQSALAADAATSAAVYHPDYFRNGEHSLPADFKDVMDLARKRHVALAGIPLNLLMDFYMYCAISTEHFLDDPDKTVETSLGVSILEDTRQLAFYCSKFVFQRDPIQVHKVLAEDSDLYYCPYAYGHTNYSRRGYCSHPLKAMDLIIYRGRMLHSVLGGTGLAMSSLCENRETALRFAGYAASPPIQTTLYTENGGQPGRRKVWLDEINNNMTMNFFKDTLNTLDHSYLRPRYNGYLHSQDHAGDYIQDYTMNGGSPVHMLDQLNQFYRKSREEFK